MKGIEEKYVFVNSQLTQTKADNERLNQQLREAQMNQATSQNGGDDNDVLSK